MKKLSYLIVLVLILGLTLTGCTLLSNIGQIPTSEQSGITYLTKHTEDTPQVTILLAGQTIPVGTVKVWNDGVNLYVKYETTGGWKMTETHLAVATSLDGIPHTKTGNPIPGKFEYSTEHDPWLTEYIYEVDLDTWTSETILHIAAHAVVVDTNSTQTVSIVSNEGDTVYGPLYTATSIGSVDWGTSKTATEAINNITNPLWQWGLSPFRSGVDIPGALWISTASYTEDNGLADSWRWFTEDLEVPKYPVPNSGELLINANNEYWIYLNGTFVGTDNWSFPTTGIETWFFDPIMGTNTFDFLVKNFAYEHETDNPNGLTYEVTADYYDRIETAWADGERFVPKGNWATYFTYAAEKMPLWNSTGEADVGYTCAGGALKTVEGPYGFVILNIDASDRLIVEFVLEGATANKDFKLYINQVDVNGTTCTIKSPNMVGELTTDHQGNGNAHFNLPHWVDADKFWVSAMELPMPYYDPITKIPNGLMLRSEAVALD
jgi:hypothetical protein